MSNCLNPAVACVVCKSLGWVLFTAYFMQATWRQPSGCGVGSTRIWWITATKIWSINDTRIGRFGNHICHRYLGSYQFLIAFFVSWLVTKTTMKIKVDSNIVSTPKPMKSPSWLFGSNFSFRWLGKIDRVILAKGLIKEAKMSPMYSIQFDAYVTWQ